MLVSDPVNSHEPRIMPLKSIVGSGIAKAYKKFHAHPCLFARKMPLGRTNGKPLNQGL